MGHYQIMGHFVSQLHKILKLGSKCETSLFLNYSRCKFTYF